MVSFLFNKIRPIALDVGSNSVKMMQLGCSADKVRIMAVGERQIPFNSTGADRNRQITEAIIEIYQKGGFKGKEVISCLGNQQADIKNFKVDALVEGNDNDELIYNEAQARFGLNADKYDMNYIITGNTRQGDEIKSEVILFSVEKNLILEHIELIEKAGLVPVAIDTVPCALFRCFMRNLRRQEDSDQITIFIDIGSRFSTLIIGKGQELSFVKQIPLGGYQLNEKVASKLDITIDEASLMRARLNSGENENFDQSTRQVITDAITSVISQLTREISLCFKYFTVTFKGKRPDKAFCTGGEAYENLIVDSLNQTLNVDVELAKPLKGLELSSSYFENDRRRCWCEWAIPVGLSFKGMNLENYQTIGCVNDEGN